MKKLLIDIGNTAMKVGVFEGDRAIQIDSFKKVELNILEAIFCSHPSIHYSAVSNVSREYSDIEAFLKTRTSFIPVRDILENTLHPSYTQASSIGSDRLLMMKACLKKYPKQNVLCIGMGSCITYNMINKDGLFEGGSISPGLRMRHRAMSDYTARLPYVEANFEKPKLFERQTEKALQSGVYNGIFYEISGITDTYRQLFPELTVIITGGDIIYFDFSLKNGIFAEPNLVLTGLSDCIDLYVRKEN